MTHATRTPAAGILLAAALLLGLAATAHADVVTDWNIKAGELIIESRMGTPPAVRVMAIVQTAVNDAVQAANRPGSVEAAVAAANRTVLTRLMPAQQASIDAAYQAALANVAEGPAKSAGISAGEQAGQAALALRAGDAAVPAETYRPHTTAGAYVPTAAPAAPQWALRKPWLMARADQFRPGPPPALTSDTWARDYNEVKSIGARNSGLRSAEQTEIARFWEYSLPPIYHAVVRSVARAPGRDVARNARLFAAVAQGMDDAMIAVLDAKYHYNFWRPVTAIRNGDSDGHAATERDATWLPLIDAPMHPEYPSAHSILAATVATVLQADIDGGPAPLLVSASPTAKGAVRQWTSLDAFVREVGDARVYEGIHFRTSVQVGAAMGERVGRLAVTRFLRAPHAGAGTFVADPRSAWVTTVRDGH